MNHDAAELLCRTAAGLLEGGDVRLLDLYCGIGTIGLSMSRHCDEICGVEIVPEAVECARATQRATGLETRGSYARIRQREPTSCSFPAAFIRTSSCLTRLARDAARSFLPLLIALG